ncbi:MAG: nuclear transport factor 2 family protein [Candidatus Hodarchaeales archaeon]|jgi:ketosteroid isomerase-like protein
MKGKDPKIIALLYNECINNRDLEGIIALMAENHKFIDSKNRVENKEQMKKSWKEFFAEYPDYRNIFHTVISRENLVILLGHSVCSEPVLAIQYAPNLSLMDLLFGQQLLKMI